MSQNKSLLVLGFVAFDSNEINMLKYIVRFARLQGAQWHLVCLKTPDLDWNQSEIERKVESLRQLCDSMGGTFAYVEDALHPDMLKMQLFELNVAGHQVKDIVIDHQIEHLNEKHPIFESVRNCQSPNDLTDASSLCTVSFHNIDSYVDRPGAFTRMVRRIKSFFAASMADIAIGFLFGFFAILIALSVHFIFDHYWSQVADTYVYLILIIFANICALQAGVWGGIICTILTSLGANYFFMSPVYNFDIHETSDIINWGAFIVTSLLTSTISALMVMQYRKSEIKEKNLSLLLDINSSPLKHKDMRAILADLRDKLCYHLKTDVAFFVPALINENTLEAVFEEDAEKAGINPEHVDALWTDLREGKVFSYKDNPHHTWAYVPLSTMSNDVGVLAIKKSTNPVWLDYDLDYRTLSEMIATILEYIKADQQSYARDVMKEKDKLRMHILSSVSHDLKTPLASIIGSLGLYMSSHSKLKEQQIKALVDNAYAEANRLDGFITNILVMTKLEAGLIKFRTEKIKPAQLVNTVLDKIRWRLLDNQDRVTVNNIDFADLVTVDVAASELAVLNILDNALRHAEPGTQVSMRFEKTDQGGFTLVVHNKGESIPQDEMDNLFDKYHRLHKEDTRQAGTGLGISLSHGLLRGQNGDIQVINKDGGVAFILRWPAGSVD
jgi:two-component system sensor histidine kinase KdpD